jgi:hypothetical protein
MIRCRYYLLSEGGRVQESEMLECETQAEAAVIARLILQDRRDCQSIEVWEGTRCIEKASRSSLR